MRDPVARRGARALAYAVAVFALVAGASVCAVPASAASAAAATHAIPIAGAARPNAAPGCVTDLRERRTGSGAKSYASRYVTDGAYAYGQWRAGAFGGQSLWHKRGTQWCKTETGLVTLDRAAIVNFGVPAANARRLVAKMRAAGELSPAVAATPRNALGSAPRGGSKRR